MSDAAEPHLVGIVEIDLDPANFRPTHRKSLEVPGM
jgi:hypothetical protein